VTITPLSALSSDGEEANLAEVVTEEIIIGLLANQYISRHKYAVIHSVGAEAAPRDDDSVTFHGSIRYAREEFRINGYLENMANNSVIWTTLVQFLGERAQHHRDAKGDRRRHCGRHRRYRQQPASGPLSRPVSGFGLRGRRSRLGRSRSAR